MQLLRTTALALSLTVPLALSGHALAQADDPVVDRGEGIVYFGFDSAELDSAGQSAVQDAAAAFQQSGAERVVLSGFTDTVGDPEYNRRLAERRAQAVADAMANAGVPRDAIEVVAVGEDEQLVPTGDSNQQQGNRRVSIEVFPPVEAAQAGQAAQAAEAAPVSPPPPSADDDLNVGVITVPATPQPQPQQRQSQEDFDESGGLFGFNVSAIYGLDIGDGEDEDKYAHFGGLNIGTEFGLGFLGTVSLDQAGFYQFAGEEDGWGGRTTLGTAFNIPLGPADRFIPQIGANIGYLFGEGIEDDFFAGPEIGVRLPFADLSVAYDIPFNRDWDTGIVWFRTGFGLRLP